MLATIARKLKEACMEPTLGNGKICYVEIPSGSMDVHALSKFYADVFGWSLRERGNGELSFDDGVGQVSGMWVPDRAPASADGLRVSIMVDDAEAILKAIEANGGAILEGIGAHAPEITARFTDPYGNVFSIYQEPA